MRWRGCPRALSGAVAAGLVATLAVPAMAETIEPKTVLDKARSAVEDFRTGHTSSGFSAALARADAAIVVPVLDETGSTPGEDEAGRPAVVVVRDGVIGPWSDPAFYRVQSRDGKAPYPGLAMTFLIMRTDAITRLKEGSAELGGEDGLRVDPVNVGVDPDAFSDPLPHMVAFVKVNEASTLLPAFDGWKVTADPALNEQFYRRSLAPAEILSRGAAETREPESLLDALRTAEEHEAPDASPGDVRQ